MKVRPYNLSLFIRNRREERKMTQTELGKYLGYKNSQFVSNVERNLCPFPVEKMPDLSVLLRVELEVLVEIYLKDLVRSFRETLDSEILKRSYGN